MQFFVGNISKQKSMQMYYFVDVIYIVGIISENKNQINGKPFTESVAICGETSCLCVNLICKVGRAVRH